MLSPFGKMDGLYFDDSMEPDDEVFRLRNAVEELAASKDVTLIKLNFEEKDDYYRAMNAFRNFANENIKVYTSSNEDDCSLIVNEEVVL